MLILAQTEGTQTVFLHHFTDFQSKVLMAQYAWFFKLSINISISNANSLHNETRLCYVYHRKAPHL